MVPFRGWNADIRFAFRLLWRERWFTLTAVVTLALAMGMSDTVYTVVNAMILRGLPVAHPDRIVLFNDGSSNSFVLNASYRDVGDWRERTSSFAEIALWTSALMTIGDEGRTPEVIAGSYVSANMFRVVEQPPLLGRDFLPNDEQPGAAAVVALGYTVWTTRYGRDPTIVGRVVRVNDKPATIVAVMPAGFRFPLVDDMWMPVSAMPALELQKRDVRPFRVCGRLRAGVSMSRANAELASVADRLAGDYPATNRRLHPRILPFTGTVSFAMYQALFGAVACLLLIACANVSNLLLARAGGRRYEVAIRLALGASRWRIIRQLVIESFILAVAAGGAGVLLALAGVKAFAYAVEGINFPYWYRDHWTMDHRVLAYLVLVCMTTPIVFGVVPAIQLVRDDVNEQLKRDSRTATSGSHAWANALLAAEVTVALMLLVAAGLMVRSFLAEYHADLTADAAHVITASLRLPPARAATAAQRVALYRRIEERVRANPLVLAATFASTPPYIGAPMYEIARDEHRPTDSIARRASLVAVDPGYFETLDVRLLRGRPFGQDDGLVGHEAAIVNQQFVDMFFRGIDPLTERVCAFNADNRQAPPLCAPIVGVSPTVRQQFMADLDPVIYFPLRVNPGAAMLLVRGADANGLATAVRAEVRAVEPGAILWRIMPLETWMQQSRWGYRVFGTMFTVFALIALTLSAVGIYAVTAFSVVERTREIGIRIALGAPAGRVALLFARRTLVPLSIGLALGLAGALGVGRLMRNMLVQTSATDPATVISLGGLLGIVAACAAIVPAVRASRIQPSVTLRHE